jgi:hypothetical protein
MAESITGSRLRKAIRPGTTMALGTAT